MGRIKRLPLTLAFLLYFSTLSTTALAKGGPELDEPLDVATSWADELGPGMDPEKDLEPGTDAETDEEPSEPLTPEGNMTLVDDQGGTAAEKKERQFLTVTSRNGNYFYLVIDRANDGSENVHFLNQVDEADLLPLIESGDEDAGSAPAACSCTEKCHIGAIKTDCEICAVNMAECAGVEPEPEPEASLSPEGEAEPEPEKKSGVNLFPVLLGLLLAGGGAVWFFKFRRKKPDTKGSDDLEDYDYGDEDELEDEAGFEDDIEE